MLTRDTIAAFLEATAEHLDGRWVLLGGAVVALLLDPERGTEDIDLVPYGDSPGERLRLMEASEQAGLGVETVNSAAGYFLRRLDGWEDDVVPLFARGNFEVLRPGARLFVRSKLGRMSERDLRDCLMMVAAEGAGLDWGLALEEIAARDAISDNPAANVRRGVLADALRGC